MILWQLQKIEFFRKIKVPNLQRWPWNPGPQPWQTPVSISQKQQLTSGQEYEQFDPKNPCMGHPEISVWWHLQVRHEVRETSHILSQFYLDMINSFGWVFFFTLKVFFFFNERFWYFLLALYFKAFWSLCKCYFFLMLHLLTCIHWHCCFLFYSCTS